MVAYVYLVMRGGGLRRANCGCAVAGALPNLVLLLISIFNRIYKIMFDMFV